MLARIPIPTRRFSLRVQLILLVALIALPALGLLVSTGLERREADAEAARDRAIQVSRDVGAGYISTISATQAFVRPIAALLTDTATIAEVAPETCVEFLQTYLGTDAPYAAIHVVAPDGEVACASQPVTRPISFAESPVFHAALASTGPVVGSFQIDPLTDLRVLPVAQTLLGAAGAPIGVLIFMIDTARLNLAVAVDPLPEGSFATVVDQEGLIIARYPDRPELIGTSISQSANFAQIVDTKEGALDGISAEGAESLIGYSPIDPDGGAFVLVGTPRAQAYAGADSALQRNLLLLGLITAYVVALAWLGAERIILKPLRRVVDVADRIEAGDRAARVGPAYGVGELGTLGHAFDDMADAVDQREAYIDELNASLERRVEERTAELVAANSELESFSYTVSHDLRAPLRAIDGFSELLQAKYQDGLPDEAQRFVERIRMGAIRMGSLIDDLLQFSRLTRVDLVTRSVSLDSLVEEVVEEFRGATDERAIEWRIGRLGSADVDPGMMRRVFANLVGNAVKFSRDRAPAVVEIGRTEDREGEAEGAVTYFVRDNGVGFDMAHATHMFGVFQRLHLQEEFEGTGIGLAIVERVIERHGGRVWAESSPGQGATFFFTLGAGDAGGTPA